MNCPNCGAEIEENQKFCVQCGAKLMSCNNGHSYNFKPLAYSVVGLIILSSLAVGLYFVSSSDNNVSRSNVGEETIENDDTAFDPEIARKMLEESEKEKEIQKSAQQNCIYRTSDGVCFKTTVFMPEPLDYYDCTGGWTTYGTDKMASGEYSLLGIKNCHYGRDYWAGAIKQCNDWGFKLADRMDLNSLAKDIYGVIVSDENESYLPPKRNINNVPINKLFSSRVSLWESTEANAQKAYERHFFNSSTYRTPSPRIWDNIGAVCVYNSYGVEKTSYADYIKQKEKEAEEKRQYQEKLKRYNEAQNELF